MGRHELVPELGVAVIEFPYWGPFRMMAVQGLLRHERVPSNPMCFPQTGTRNFSKGSGARCQDSQGKLSGRQPGKTDQQDGLPTGNREKTTAHSRDREIQHTGDFHSKQSDPSRITPDAVAATY